MGYIFLFTTSSVMNFKKWRSKKLRFSFRQTAADGGAEFAGLDFKGLDFDGPNRRGGF